MQTRVVLVIDGQPDDPETQISEGVPAKAQALTAAVMAAANAHYPDAVAADLVSLEVKNELGPWPVPVLGS